MFTFKSESANGINGTAKYMVDVHLAQKVELTDDIGCMMKRYEVYASREEATLIDGLADADERQFRPWSHKLLGGIEAYHGRLDGRLPDEWMYRADSARGNIREYPAFGPPTRRFQAASRIFDEGDWNDAVDWIIGWANPSGELYDLAVRHFSSSGDLMMHGIIPQFNERFMDLGA